MNPVNTKNPDPAEWRRNLEVDDLVIVTRSIKADLLLRVARVTPTRVIVGVHDLCFSKETGRQIGYGGFHPAHIDYPDAVRAAEIREATAIRRNIMRDIDSLLATEHKDKRLPIASLKAIRDHLTPKPGEDNGKGT